MCGRKDWKYKPKTLWGWLNPNIRWRCWQLNQHNEYGTKPQDSKYDKDIK